MKVRWPVWVGVVLLAGLALWLLMLRAPEFLVGVEKRPIQVNAAEVPPRTTKHPEGPSDSAAPPVLPSAVPVKPQRPAAAIAAHMEPSPEPDSGLPPLTVLENMRSVFRQYSSRFGGNPVGNNREITATLNGKNAGQVTFVNPEDGLRVNERGELVDNWGTPFFFHQISGTIMEIHSAGPDRKMWTSDDLVVK